MYENAYNKKIVYATRSKKVFWNRRLPDLSYDRRGILFTRPKTVLFGLVTYITILI